MTMHYKLTEQDFFKHFKPIKNHVTQHSGYEGCMFDTHGDDFAFVKSCHETNPLYVWTLINGPGTSCYIVNGFYSIDRLGYFITFEKWHQACSYSTDESASGLPLFSPLAIALCNIIEHCESEKSYFLDGDGSDTSQHEQISEEIGKVSYLLQALSGGKKDAIDFIKNQLYI